MRASLRKNPMHFFLFSFSELAEAYDEYKDEPTEEFSDNDGYDRYDYTPYDFYAASDDEDDNNSVYGYVL